MPRVIGKDAHWVEPQLVAQIAFTERTTDGLLRHPAFLVLRGDKPAREVQTQQTVTVVAKKPTASKSADEVAGVKITHPDRVLFAATATTKLDLAEYFLAVSDRMLPYCSRRALSLVRCPEGPANQCFFQKHTKKGMPDALKSVPVPEGDGEVADYLMVDSAAGLVAVAQIGGIEIHLWGSRARTLEKPDRLVFDLDPDPSVDFDGVRAAARDVRKLLETAGLETFPLITGGKGIHVVAPLDASQDWETIKGFAKGVATKLAEHEPDRFIATMSKAKRKGRIFIDWLRNERGSTAIAPYSPRAKAEASVAVPVSWTELSRIEAASAFTIPDVLKRIKRKADPWAGYFDVRQKISKEALRFFV
jgi:bifunctional non-homologous end joining protein LigD